MATGGEIPKRVQLNLSNFTLDDIIDELDHYTQQCEVRACADNKLLKLNSEVHHLEPPKNVIKQKDASVLLTAPMDTPEQIKKSLELEDCGKNPITGEKDTVIRSVGPKSNKIKKQLKEKDTTGPGWFELPKTEMTAELKRDLQVISMRDALDPKRFFKKDKSSSKVPKYSQVGHIVEGSTEFYSARQSKKERKRTIVEEVLAEEAKNHKHKCKYNEIMAENRRNATLNRKRIKRKK